MLRRKTRAASNLGENKYAWLRAGSGLWLFIGLMLYKLTLLHHQLDAQNIDMNPVDYLIAIGSLLLASFWTLWLPGRARQAALLLLHVIMTAIIYSDMVYYRYFGDFITIPVLLQAGQVDSLGDSIASLLYWKDIFFFMDWIIFLLWMMVKLVRRRRDAYSMYLSTPRSPRSRWVWVQRLVSGVVAFALGWTLTFVPINIYTSTWAKGIFVGNWWSLALYNVTGLVGFHGYDLYRFGKEHIGPKPVLGNERTEEAKAWFDQHQQLLNTDNDLRGKFKGSNVMVIQGEAFMNFFIGQQVGGEEITPNFNKLMEESMYFSNFYHQTGQGRTSDADFSAHSSLHPLPTGSVFIRYPANTFDMLPSILKNEGYSPNVFHAYDSSFWNRYSMYKAMHYDRFYSKKDFVIDEPLGWSLGDKSMFRQSLEALTTDVKSPFYAFMITLSSHHPYTLTAKENVLDVGELQGTMLGDYLQSVHYVDAALGELVEQMKQDGLWDHTILMFYGDHDNSITEQKLYEQFTGRSLNALDMQQIMNQVPLLVHVPGGSLQGVDSQPAGQLDLTPSILHLLGISPEPYHFMGNNLFGDAERMVVLRSGAFTDGKVYYIPSADQAFENGTCYDLATRTPTDVQACGPGFQEAKKRLQISDEVITYNLLQLWENKENLVNPKSTKPTEADTAN